MEAFLAGWSFVPAISIHAVQLYICNFSPLKTIKVLNDNAKQVRSFNIVK